MKFGVRQIANVVFRAADTMTVGAKTFQKGQPVFYLDTAKTSSMEGGATAVYATGGRGNTRLLSWEGEKTLTFTVEDALLSPISFSMLSGAGILQGDYVTGTGAGVHVHQTTVATITVTGTNTLTATIDLTDAMVKGEELCKTAPIYVLAVDRGGDLTGDTVGGNSWVATTTSEVKEGTTVTVPYSVKLTQTVSDNSLNGVNVMVDYYVIKTSNKVTEIQIDAQHFGGYFYVEADTLFRRQIDGTDLPAILTFPSVKIQSNFTFSMAATGDPSTFTFTMDAFPAYTYFNKTKKVLCAIQVVEDTVKDNSAQASVFRHPANINIDESYYDSSVVANNDYNIDAGTESDIEPNG